MKQPEQIKTGNVNINTEEFAAGYLAGHVAAETFGWNDELVTMYAEVYRFSSGRISIEQFQEILKAEEWDGVRVTAKMVMQEWENREKVFKELYETSINFIEALGPLSVQPIEEKKKLKEVLAKAKHFIK